MGSANQWHYMKVRALMRNVAMMIHASKKTLWKIQTLFTS